MYSKNELDTDYNEPADDELSHNLDDYEEDDYVSYDDLVDADFSNIRADEDDYVSY